MTASRPHQAAPDVPRLWWSAREFATAFGINQHTVYRMCRDGQLAWTLIGGEKRIPNSELERLLSEAYGRRSA